MSDYEKQTPSYGVKFTDYEEQLLKTVESYRENSPSIDELVKEIEKQRKLLMECKAGLGTAEGRALIYCKTAVARTKQDISKLFGRIIKEKGYIDSSRKRTFNNDWI